VMQFTERCKRHHCPIVLLSYCNVYCIAVCFFVLLFFFFSLLFFWCTPSTCRPGKRLLQLRAGLRLPQRSVEPKEGIHGVAGVHGGDGVGKRAGDADATFSSVPGG